MWERTILSDKIRDPNLENESDAAMFQFLGSPKPVERAYAELYFRTTWVSCPACKTDYNSLAPSGVCIGCEDKKTAEDARQEELGKYLRVTIGPYGIEKYGFDNYDVDAGNIVAWQALRDFNHLTDNIFLYGSTGTGKTHLSGAAFKVACGKNLTVAWLQPLYVGRTLRAKFPEQEEAIINEWVGKDVVIIDDLGVGRDLDVTLRMIYELLDKRKARKRNGLIISSNENLDKLSKAFKDARIMSRITGLCAVINVIGSDGRMRAAGQ